MSYSLLAHPAVQLLLLWAASALARRFLMGSGESPAASGGIVMAAGIFAVAALQQLQPPALVERLLVLELLVVWGYLALSYFRSGLRDGIGRYRREPGTAFAVGTWVAGTAVLVRALSEVLPGWRVPAVMLALVAVAVWVWFLRLLPGAFRAAASGSAGYMPTGAVLLSAVGTQSVVVLGESLFEGAMPGWLAAGIISVGYLFYALGFVLICQRYLRGGWSLADDWDNTNCILHGAMSITGLAAVLSGAVPEGMVGLTWAWAAGMFLLVEGVEIARLRARVRAYGLGRGVFIYHVSQWSRNFTFGMFYAFTLLLHESPAADAVAWASGLREAVLGYGHYVVLAALLAETGLFLRAKLATGRRRARSCAGETARDREPSPVETKGA